MPPSHAGHLDAAEHPLDSGVLEHGIKQADEFAVAVTDQEPRLAPGILKVHDEIPRGLDNPGRVG